MYPVHDELAKQEITGLKVLKLFSNGALELLSVSLEEGAVLPEHSSPKEAVLLVLEGRIRFHIDGREISLGKQEFLPFPAKMTHWVKALAPAKFLIIR